MVEIHFDRITLYGNNLSVQSPAFGIHHGDHGSNLHQVFIYFPIYFKYRLGNMHNGIFHYRSVCILAVKQELKIIITFQAIEVFFKLGKQSACSKQEGQWVFTGQGFYNITFF